MPLPGWTGFLAFPWDLLHAKQVEAEIIDQDQCSLSMAIEPDEKIVDEIAQKLIGARSPLLYVGDEVYTTGAQREVVELAELLAAPVVRPENLVHWSVSFPTDHPLYIGEYRAGSRYPASVDLMLNLGGNLPYHRGLVPPIPRSTKIIEVKLDVDNLARVYPTYYSIAANVKLFAGALTEAIHSRLTKSRIQKLRDTRGAQTEQFKMRLKKSLERVVEKRWSETPISLERLGGELKNVLDTQACVVHDVDTGTAALQSLDFGLGRMTYFTDTGKAPGWGVGATMGVKLAAPDRQVVGLVGDGAFMFGGSPAFWTMKRYEVPVTIIVLNNRAYDGERNRIWGLGALQGKLQKDMTCYIGDPDIEFTHLAKAFGVAGQQVTDPNDLRPALEKAMAANQDGQPYLLDVVVGRQGVGADLTWHSEYSVARQRKRKI